MGQMGAQARFNEQSSCAEPEPSPGIPVKVLRESERATGTEGTRGKGFLRAHRVVALTCTTALVWEGSFRFICDII